MLYGISQTCLNLTPPPKTEKVGNSLPTSASREGKEKIIRQGFLKVEPCTLNISQTNRQARKERED
jgi:hypothetical protein